MRLTGNYTPLTEVPITPSGRLDKDLRDNNIHNLPEGGEEGAVNEYTCNYPTAWKSPRPVDTELLQQDYWKWKARHMAIPIERENPGYRM